MPCFGSLWREDQPGRWDNCAQDTARCHRRSESVKQVTAAPGALRVAEQCLRWVGCVPVIQWNL